MSSLRDSYYSITKSEVPQLLTRPLTNDGQVTGNPAMLGNGTLVAPVKYYVTPDVNQIFEITGLNIILADNGVPGINAYGNIVGPLANGVVFFLEIDGVETYFPTAYKKNTDYARASSGFDVVSLEANIRLVLFRDIFLTYSDAKFRLKEGDKFGIKVRDNLSALLRHECQIKGHILPASL